MTSAALAAAALLATASAPTLHSGERQWFVPGRLSVGAHVICTAPGHSLTLIVPPATRAQDVGTGSFTGGSIHASISTRPNGAVEADCNTSEAPPTRPTLPYIAGPHGLGLIRGTSTVARVRRLYGVGLLRRGVPCRVSWRAIGLVAVFTSCGGTGSLVRATIVDPRWSSLNGVHIGDSIARMLWQDQGARRLTADTWALGGVGRKGPPRLLARIGRLGLVTAFVVVAR